MQDIGQPPYRVGIIGTGGIARTHGAVCNELDCIKLSAICDISQEALDQYGDTFGIESRYRNLGEMLAAEDLDIAIICNWGAYHAETAIQLAHSRTVKAILCEKPFASNAAEAEQMVRAARENNVFIAEAFKFRHHPMHLRAKELVDAGAVGDVVTIRSTLTSSSRATRTPESNWRFNKSKGGGSINDLGCYCIHHARFIFDAEPVKVFVHPQPGIEIEDGASLLLIFPEDRTAQISVGFNSWTSQYIEICGTKGILRIDKPWNNNNEPTAIELQTASGTEIVEFEATLQFTHQLRHLCDCLTTGAPHRISPESSINQMKVLDALFESMKTGAAVDLTPIISDVKTDFG